ncbi:MAG: single-stranded DNA-binding protein [Christensenellales bacterium]|nr:single-stranded DNA-binding protein [Christensenellales bacterium]
MIRTSGDNAICISGRVQGDAMLDHELYGEAFYSLYLEVPRLSGAVDILPVTLPGRLCAQLPRAGESWCIHGQLRSYNKHTDTGSRLILTVFARHVEPVPPEVEPCNRVELTGFLCKPVIYRTTPFLREIGDMLLAVNRSFNKSDYLPCIAWGRNAVLARELAVGSRVRVEGRLQSRDYQKCLLDGTIDQRVAYEVSCARVEPV